MVVYSSAPVLQMQDIRKAFPGVQALDGVHLEVYPGRVTAIVGENGAGKSTLMKILAGAYRGDSGSILIDGKPVHIVDPRAAQELGISIIYQERNLIGNLSIAENLFLGRFPTRGPLGWVDWNRLRRNAEATLDRLDMGLSPMAKVRDLSPAQQQMVEIAKALSANARILIMDEPTSALTDRETHKLFEVIARLKTEGVAIIFISHRLEEVFSVADHVIVLRDGARVGDLRSDELDHQRVVDLMVGHTLGDLYPRTPRLEDIEDEILFEVRGLSRQEVLHDISFQLRKGEILGLAGLVGAGRTELARALFGIDHVDSGQFFVEGREIVIRQPADAIAQGMGFVTEDRHREGLLSAADVCSNVTLTLLPRLVHLLGWISRKEEESIAQRFVERLAIVTTSIRQKVSSLSGGNQQKVILARWLATNPKILILDEATKGIDVGAKAEIHAMVDKLAQQGLGIILISSELPELLAMCDRVLVLRSSRIVAEYGRDEISQEKVLVSAMGKHEQPA